MAERLEKDEEWHARYDKPGSGRKGNSDESRMEAAPLSRKV